MTRLLVFTPTYGDGPRPETLASVNAQQFNGELVHEVSWHNPFPGRDMRNVIVQYQRAWGLALEGNYDALLTVEHDMVLPSDAAQKLSDTDAPVVYGVYMLRHGVPALNAWQYVDRKNLGMSLSLYPAELKKARRKGWAEVCGVGWGCTLIKKSVLEHVRVRPIGETDAGDLAFATDCLRAGYRQVARFDVPCGHIMPDGYVLDPYQQGGLVRRVLAKSNVNVNANGQTIAMKIGRYYSLPPDVASDLERAGYGVITNDDDSQEEAGEKEQPDITSRELATDPKVVKRSTRGKRAS